MKLTKSAIDQLEPQEAPYTVADDELSGFYIRVGTDSKTFIVKKKVHGKVVTRTIGKHGTFTATQAREQARRLLIELSAGIDNYKERKQEAKQAEENKEHNLEWLLNEYIRLKPIDNEKTKDEILRIKNKYLVDWKETYFQSITPHQIVEKYDEIAKEKERTANIIFKYLQSAYNTVNTYLDPYEDNGLKNPVNILTRMKKWKAINRKKSYLTFQPNSDNQLKKFFEGCHAYENKTIGNFLLVTFLTGSRESETGKLTWENVDFKKKLITFSKTKNGRTYTYPITPLIHSLLQFQKINKLKNNKFVFPSANTKTGYITIPTQKAILTIRKKVGVSFTTHDLRRTYTTILDFLGVEKHVIDRLTKHVSSDNDITSTYIVETTEQDYSTVKRFEDFVSAATKG